MHIKLLIVTILLSLSYPNLISAQPSSPWLHTYPAPARELYVSPNGNGNGTPSSPMSLTTALASSQPGDIYWLMNGTYSGSFTATRDGQSSAPVVYRAATGHRPTIEGNFEINADHTWLWGLEITDPNNISPNKDGIGVFASGAHVINNIIHNVCFDNGIGGWNTGSGQVYYGNILYDNGCGFTGGGGPPHNIYTQNNYDTSGYKYYVNNIVQKTGCTTNCFGFHGYAENNFVSGFYLVNNIFAQQGWILGGVNVPHHHNVINNNYFFHTNPRLWYQRPHQFTFTNNYIANGTLSMQHYWSEGDVQYTKELPNVITGNSIMNQSGIDHYQLYTSAYLQGPDGNPVLRQGLPRLDSRDIVNNNIFSSPFKAWLWADGTSAGSTSLSNWRTRTASAGNEFDTNSIESPQANIPRVVIFPNEYDPHRFHVGSYNWNNANVISIDLQQYIPQGTPYKVVQANDFYGTPLAQGLYSTPIFIPTNGAEHSQLVVITEDPLPSRLVGDANNDGKVDGLDYVIWLNNYNTNTTQGPDKGDFNSNGKVDGVDYVVWLNKYIEAQSGPQGTTLEAENAQLSGPMTTNGTYISSSIADQGSATFTVNISQSGTYSIWAYVLSPDSSKDSFYVSVDGGAEDIFDTAEGKWSANWQWSQVNGRNGTSTPLTLNPRTFTLNSGNHTIVFRGRDASTQLDKIVVSKL